MVEQAFEKVNRGLVYTMTASCTKTKICPSCCLCPQKMTSLLVNTLTRTDDVPVGEWVISQPVVLPSTPGSKASLFPGTRTFLIPEKLFSFFLSINKNWKRTSCKLQ